MTNADACKALIDSQAAKGLSKYGVPLERSDASVSRLARHGAEEMADALAYFVELGRRAAALEAALNLAWDLSTYAACINWRARDKDNTGEWLDELRELIEATQAAIKAVRAGSLSQTTNKE